jgi:hypothetical protein
LTSILMKKEKDSLRVITPRGKRKKGMRVEQKASEASIPQRKERSRLLRGM